jgi:hypothetical protein
MMLHGFSYCLVGIAPTHSHFGPIPGEQGPFVIALAGQWV